MYFVDYIDLLEEPTFEPEERERKLEIINALESFRKSLDVNIILSMRKEDD